MKSTWRLRGRDINQNGSRKVEDRNVYLTRLEEVVDRLQGTEIDALLLNRVSNIAYLTGAVNSCSWVLVSRQGKKLALILDSDIPSYAAESVIEDLRTFRMHDPISLFRRLIEEVGFPNGKLGLEFSRPGIPHHTLAMLRHAFPEKIEFVNCEHILEEMRIIKADQEVEAIGRAAEFSELGMKVALENIRPGVKESEVALEAEYAIRKAGGRLGALCYVSSGQRSGLVHHRPSGKEIDKGDVVTLDIHGAYGAYCADLARTVVCGRIEPDVAEAHACLVEAQEKAVDACRSGVKIFDVKKLFYSELNRCRGLKYLTGPVLHWVGMMNAELPSFDFPHHHKGFPEVLETNMVLALSNIGLYSPRGWGVRIEDTFNVTEAGPEYLTGFSKELLSL